MQTLSHWGCCTTDTSLWTLKPARTPTSCRWSTSDAASGDRRRTSTGATSMAGSDARTIGWDQVEELALNSVQLAFLLQARD